MISTCVDVFRSACEDLDFNYDDENNLDAEIRGELLNACDLDTNFSFIDSIDGCREVFADILDLRQDYKDMNDYLIENLPAKPKTMYPDKVSIDLHPSIFDEINNLQSNQQSQEIVKLHQNVEPERTCLSGLSLKREILNENYITKWQMKYYTPRW